MPSGQNSVFSPASKPVFDPDPVRGDRKRYQFEPAAAVANELPPFELLGAVDALSTSPGFPVPAAGTITSTNVTVLTNPGGISVTFKVRVNGTVMATHTVSAVGLTTFTESIALAVNDIVQVEISAKTGNTMTGFLVEFRLGS